MKRVLLDADAFLCLRKLGLLVPIARAAPEDQPLLATEYIARKELAAVSAEVGALQAAGRLDVIPVEASKHTETGRLWSELRGERIDKGEAEALAWLLTLKGRDRPVFVSRESAARRVAKSRHLPTDDVFGLVVVGLDRALCGGAGPEGMGRQETGDLQTQRLGVVRRELCETARGSAGGVRDRSGGVEVKFVFAVERLNWSVSHSPVQ